MRFLKPILFVTLFTTVAFQSHAQDNVYNLDETYSIDQKGTVHLESDDADVTIQGTDRSDVHLVVYHKVDVDGWEIKSGEDFKMEVENRGGDLHIREAEIDDKRFLVGNIHREYRITIEVPRDVALNIKGDDGTYDISDINLGVKLSADDSQVDLRDVKGKEFEFNIDDGTVRLDEGGGKLMLNLDDSEFSVRQGNFGEIDGAFDDSEVDITNSLLDDGIYQFDMDDSELRANITGGGGEFDIRHEDTDISVDDNFEEVSSEEERSVYRLAGGKAHIEINSDDGDIELRTI